MAGRSEKEGFLKKLGEAKPRDEQILSTSVGPHRDDFELENNEQSVVGYLSRGQMRALTLALKILERQYLELKLKQTPVMLLDDVFSEFDEKHQGQLIEFLKTFPQVFLSTAHLPEIEKHLPQNTQIHNIADGTINSLPLRGEG